MRSTPFRTIIEQVLGLAGQVYDSTASAQLEQVSNFITLRMQEAYDYYPFPELRKREERAFANRWYATVSYAVSDVVWDPTTEKYYAALQAHSNVVVTNATYWEEASTPATLLVNYEQLGATKIGRVWGVYATDPNTSTSNTEYDYVQTEDGIAVPGCTAKTVWVVFTPPAPRWTARTHVTTAGAYRRYDVVYSDPNATANENFPDRGECYVAEYDSNNAIVWVKQPFPTVLSRFVVYAAGSDLLRYYGKKDQADDFESRAYQFLGDERDKVGLSSMQSWRGIG